MMKKTTLPLLLVSGLFGCSAANTTLDVSASAQNVPLIPAPATSCLAIKQAGSNVPTSDISASYFRIPKITFTKKNPTNIMTIAQIKITMLVPGATTNYECKIAGDALSALSDDTNWWGSSGNSGTHDSMIPSGTATFTTNCALYCGGINGDTPFSASALMEITGYEQPPNSDEQTAVKTQFYFQVDNQ